ncbi:MAG: hypothetical protein KUG77_22825 [Nannocystaceae bacterium]|nr:hypothetical protein [Nannocystaceae bacterium]
MLHESRTVVLVVLVGATTGCFQNNPLLDESVGSEGQETGSVDFKKVAA